MVVASNFLLRELLAELGHVADEKRTNWELGAQLREAYKRKYGALPAKQLREKASGAGSHCFAVYPASFKGEAREIVAEHMRGKARQLGIFD